MNIIDNIERSEAQSVTAAVCENAALYGAAPERDEFDTRDVWDADDAIEAVHEAFRILAQGVGPDGTQLSDERESLLWGFVNMLDSQTQRLDRAADKLLPGLRDLQREQDGTEIKSRELELVTDRSQNLTARRDAFETMRDAASGRLPGQDRQHVATPRRGSHTSQTGKLTSAAIDARDFQRARKDRKTMAHLPQGTLVAITGGKDIADPAAVIERLDKARAKYADMVLVHGGGPGVEKIAASWADRNGVHQIVCKPDWDRHGRAAPFRRNDELLNLLPKGVIAFPGSAASPRTSSTRQGSSASRSSASRRSPHHLDGPRRLPGGAVRSSFSRQTVLRRHRHPRARFAPRSPPRFARRPPAAPLRTTADRYRSALGCAEYGIALPVAPLPALVQALLRSPPALRSALPRAVRPALPSAQSPRRLRSAGFTGVDLPIFHTA